MEDEISRFRAAVTPAFLPLYTRLENLIYGLFPDARVTYSYKILMYHNQKRWTGLGLRKDGVSLYTNNPDFIAGFKSRHPHVKNGKACLNFRLTDEFSDEDILEVIHLAMDEKKQLP